MAKQHKEDTYIRDKHITDVKLYKRLRWSSFRDKYIKTLCDEGKSEMEKIVPLKIWGKSHHGHKLSDVNFSRCL